VNRQDRVLRIQKVVDDDLAKGSKGLGEPISNLLKLLRRSVCSAVRFVTLYTLSMFRQSVNPAAGTSFGVIHLYMY
jgi:hypothetical protein